MQCKKEMDEEEEARIEGVDRENWNHECVGNGPLSTCHFLSDSRLTIKMVL